MLGVSFNKIIFLTKVLCGVNNPMNYNLIFNDGNHSIKVSKSSGTAIADIVITNQSGQVLKNERMLYSGWIINAQDLPTGIYYLSIFENTTRVKTEKFLKRF